MNRLILTTQIAISVLAFVLPASGQVQFQELSQQAGITHMHQSGERMGGGVAIFDFNNDGLQDIYLTGGEAPDKLYKNLGNWQFQDVSLAAGITSIAAEGSFGVTTGDIDNDGLRDILVTGDAGYRSKLLHNQGNETFVELTNAFNDGELWKTAASMGDVNGDRFLDLYIGQYIKSPQFILDGNQEIIGFDHICLPNFLFLNDGDLTFSDVSTQYGVADTGCALAVAFTDFDFDNDPDLFVANDFGEWLTPNTIFENSIQNNEMIDQGAALEMNLEMYGMGIAIGDYDHDSDLDYYQTNLGRNELSRNDGGAFTDVTSFANVESDSAEQLLHTGWGTFFFDADNDSWQDLFVANGEIAAADIIANVELDSNRLYYNNGNGTFTDISNTAGVGSVERSRGAAYGDLDNDGRLDFVVNNVGNAPGATQVELYRNVSNSGNWLGVRLRGIFCNRDAFGARVRVVVDGNSTVAEVDGGSSHASQNSSILHFGLGSETEVDSVIVTFPSGNESIIEGVASNQTLTVVEQVTVSVPTLSETLEARVSYINHQPMFTSGFNGQAEFELHDVSGRLLNTFSKEVTVGTNQLSELNGLATAMYLLTVRHNGISKSLRFTVLQ